MDAILQQDNLIEILSYLNLVDLAQVRKISKAFCDAAEQRKQYIFHHLLGPNAHVEIRGLLSDNGKVYNGRVGTIVGKPDSKTSRFPVQILYITGETFVLGVKATNLNPYLSQAQLDHEKKREQAISYTKDGRVREPHGVVVDQVFMLARWFHNEMSGHTYFQNLDFPRYMSLSRSDPRVGAANAGVFSFYKVKPSLAGYTVPHDETIYELVVKSLVNSQEGMIQNFGRKTKWSADGPNGQLLVRNFVRFMSTWDREHVIGKFWIVKSVKTGTILVSESSDGSLEKVYLVKGLANRIGDLFLRHGDTPVQGVLTIVPIYNFLVYDGIALGTHSLASATKKKEIVQFVDNAIKSESVIYQGESASLGKWDDTEPPMLPRIRVEDDTLDWGLDPMRDTTLHDVIDVTEGHKIKAQEMVKLAKKYGVVSLKSNSIKASVTVRRYGYTESDNPNNLCTMLLRHKPVHMFSFAEWPCYNLDELLTELNHCFKDIQKVPGIIMVDEVSLVEPLKSLLDEAFQEESRKGKETPRVVWYPPPSAMEQAFNQMNV